MNRFLRRVAGAALVVTLVAAESACISSDGNGIVDAALQSPFAPVVIKVLKRRAATISGPAGIATLVGLYGVEELRKESLRRANSTFLVVRQQLGGKPKASVFRFDSGHRVRVAMNGKFDELIDKNVVTLTADPAVDSTIVVTDATTGDTVARTGSFNMTVTQAKAYTGIDFDSGQQLRRDDGTMDYSFYEVRFVNGARVHKWTGDGDPTLADCSSVPSDEWSSSLLTFSPGHVEFCIVTSEARFGYLRLTSNVVASNRWVLWPPLR
ncbi:hypothetical protein [Actinoplanes sp. N902-109]|uniref:hypothetical protein n=1 Tax=Actinoplanes sp. (strain N902-109) TaxID=649831 RepID=UPI0003294E9E|nr:hypothetical protein [Actinoplanes sp. N902-109]AGL18747.1 hypothetical protein L083_5237 [Actinoplanes sp. N902-109]